ncbi:MAG: hypothetical protein PHV52_00190 [Aliarcobacter sp.]|nr:hypothetical protein [Aliarcobacter sp.]
MIFNEYNKNGQARKVIKYGAASVIDICSLPVGTDVAINITVDEVFNAGSTIKIGTNLEDDKFVNSFSVAAIGGKNSEIRFTTTEAEKEIKAVINQNTTAGACTVKVDYVLPTNYEVNY